MSIISTKLNGLIHRALLIGRIILKSHSLHNIRNRQLFTNNTKSLFASKRITYGNQHISSSHVETDADAQTKLIKTLINDGNNDEASKLIQQSKDFNIDQMCDIILNAAINDNEIIVEKTLSLLPKTIQNFKQIHPKLQNICTEVYQTNWSPSFDIKLDPYHLIIRHLPVPALNERTTEYGSFLMKEMILVNDGVSNILEFCDNLIASKRNINAIHTCYRIIVELNLPFALEFLEALSVRQQLDPNQFNVLIAKAKTEVDVIDIVKLATKLNVILDMVIVLKLIEKQMNLQRISLKTVKSLMDASIQSQAVKKQMKTNMITYYLEKERLKEASELASLYSDSIDSAHIVPALSKFIKSEMYKKFSHFTAIFIKKLQKDTKHDLAGQMLISVCDTQDQNNHFAITKRLLLDYERLDIKISRTSSAMVLDKISNVRMDQKRFAHMIPKLISDEMFPSINQKANESTHTEQTLQDAEVKALKMQLLNAEKKRLPTHGINNLL